MIRSPRVQRLAERLYPGYQSESAALDAAIRRHLPADGAVLDLGCGGGRLYPYDYRAPGRRVVGVDLDPALWENERVDGGVYASAEALPFAPGSFGLVYSRYVFEHLPDPARVFAEAARVLRPGGRLVVLTPNVWHYVAVISRMTPDWFHKRFNARARGRKAEDSFPTLYRANSRRRLRALARGAGLDEVEVRMLETRPNYLMWNVVPFLAGVAYERVVNATPLLRDLRVNVLGVYGKPGAR